MNASKENARKAQDKLRVFCHPGMSPASQFVLDFLMACERKLPTEAAYERDRKRRKVKAKAAS